MSKTIKSKNYQKNASAKMHFFAKSSNEICNLLKSISLFALILFLALTPFASASIITGFRQIEYSSGSGDLSVNSNKVTLL